MKKYVFYAGMLYGEYDGKVVSNHQLSTRLLDTPEVYNGCYILITYRAPFVQVWLRGDLTPVRLEDVPKELRVLVLLLT